MKKYRRQTKTEKLMNLLSVFFPTFSFCVIFIVEVHTVLIKVYTVFFGKKWVALKTAGCLGDCEKNWLLLLTFTFITNTK